MLHSWFHCTGASLFIKNSLSYSSTACFQQFKHKLKTAWMCIFYCPFGIHKKTPWDFAVLFVNIIFLNQLIWSALAAICLVTQNQRWFISRLFKWHTGANAITLVSFVGKWKTQYPIPVLSWITSGPVSVTLNQICYKEQGL